MSDVNLIGTTLDTVGSGAAVSVSGALNDSKVVRPLRVDADDNLKTISGSGTTATQVQGTAADGAPAVGNPVQIAGKDGTGNIQTLLTETDGTLNAKITGVASVDLNATDDEVTVFGAEGGGAGTRREIDVDSTGRLTIRIEDGLDIALGATADAEVVAGGAGSISGKIRQLTGHVGDEGDAAREGDDIGVGAGTISAKLRGVLKTTGAQADAAVLGDVAGTVSAKLRGISRILNDAWDDTANALRVTQETHDELNLNANLQVANTDVANGNPVPVSDAGGTLTVDNATLSVVGAGAELTALRTTLATETLSALESVTVQNAGGGSAVNVQDGGNSLTVDNAALSVVGGGAEATAQRVTIANDSTGVLSIDDNAGSLTVDQATASNLNAQVVGDVANGGVDAGNPVKIGMRAVAHGANPTEVDAGDRRDWLASTSGVPFMIGGHPNIISTEYRATTAQTNDEIIAAGAGTKIVVTGLAVTLDEATTVGVSVRIGFGAATLPAVPGDGAAVAGIVLSHPGLVPGGGVVRGDGSGILAIGAAGEELRITNEVPTSGDLRVTVTSYTVLS